MDGKFILISKKVQAVYNNLKSNIYFNIKINYSNDKHNKYVNYIISLKNNYYKEQLMNIINNDINSLVISLTYCFFYQNKKYNWVLVYLYSQ